MQENQSTQQIAGLYIVKLIQAALHGRTVDEKPACGWKALMEMAAWNSVDGICAFGLNSLITPKEVYDTWQIKANNTLFRQVSFAAEREEILAQMAADGLSFLPLKGILLEEYYPKPGMRTMADNDILYGYVVPCSDGGFQNEGRDDTERRDKIADAQKAMVAIMKGLGYEVESLLGNHDCYMKKPCFNFEMHRSLMSIENPLYRYYENPWKRALQKEDNPYHFCFSDEDEYLYFLAHAFKHFDAEGCGIRCVIDEYVLLQKKGATLDWNYIRGELEELGIAAFERDLRDLAQNAFGPDGELTAANKEMLFYMLACGTYGLYSIGVGHKLDRISEGEELLAAVKWKYWKERFFVSDEKCKEYFPFFYRHRGMRWLLPGYRLVRGMIRNPGKLWREWKHVKNYEK